MTAINSKPLKVLLLGGTSEAIALAHHLARAHDLVATLSLAGRTANPTAGPLPVRIGGFGGVDGLAAYLAKENVDLVIDATHPFAAAISTNAIAACEQEGIPLLAVERPPWTRTGGDDWEEHETIAAAIAALPQTPKRIFSSLGRQAIDALCAAPQHHYLIRVIDPITPPPALPHATIVAARGPFRTEDDVILFEQHGIECVLAKNAGGTAAYAKLAAARQMGLKVYMVRRPAIPERPVVRSINDALAWIAVRHSLCSDRGV
jgi:precorrin-6A/cobalt-precorrin-6A reductase